jgi:hypothetical protein
MTVACKASRGWTIILVPPAAPPPEKEFLFDESGAIKKPEVKRFVDKFLAAFAAWIERKAKAPA